MTDYDAGKAKGVLTLDITPYEQNIAKAKQLALDLNKIKPPSLGGSDGGLPNVTNAQAKAAAAVARYAAEQNKAVVVTAKRGLIEAQTAKELAKSSVEEQRKEVLIAKTAEAQARATAAQARANAIKNPKPVNTDAGILATARAQATLAQTRNTGKNAIIGLTQAENIYTTALGKVNQGTIQATRLQTDLARVQNRIKGISGGGGPALPRTLEEFGGQALNQLKSSFLSILGPAALVTTAIGGVQRAIAGAGEAIDEALALRQTKNALAAVAGDFKTYNVLITEARKQQVLFGGSLNDNLEGLQGLATVSRATGADLSTLIDLQKRLTLLNSGPTGGAQGARIALANALSGQITSLQRRFDIPTAELKGLNDTSKSAAERLDIVNQFLNKVGITSEVVATRVDQDAVAFRRLGQELGDAKINAGNALASNLSNIANNLATLVGVINNNPEAFLKLDQLFNGRTSDNRVTEDRLKEVQAAIAQRTSQNQISQIDQFASLTTGEDRLGDQRAQVEQLLLVLNNAGGRAADLGAALSDAFSRDNTQKTEDYVNGLKKLVKQSLEVKGATQESKDALLEELQKKIASEQHTKALGELQAQLANDSILAARGLLGAGDQALILADKYGIASDAAQDLINKQLIALNQGSRSSGALDPKVTKVTPSSTALTTAFRNLEQGGTFTTGDQRQAQIEIQKTADAQTAKILEAQNALALEKATTHAAKIAELNRQLAAENDPIKRLGLEKDIVSEQNALAAEKDRKAKSYTSELNKQVGLQERQYDSINKQKHALLDIDELTIKNRQESRKEDKELKQAERILADPRKSKLFEAAQDQIALINVQRQQRLLDISDKETTAGGSIFNGRILQSRQASGARVPTSAIPTVGAVPTSTPSLAGAQRATSGAAQHTVHLVVSDAGFKTIAEYTGPLIFADAEVQLDRVANGGQGNKP